MTSSAEQEQQQQVTIDTSQMPQLEKSAGEQKKKNKRRRRPAKNNNTKSNSDSGSTTSSESSRKPKSSKRNKKQNKKRVSSPIQSISQEEKNRYVALDCEMVGVGYNGYKSALARVCIIDWDGRVLMDSYVKPTQPVTDYRTFVSGITPQHLESPEALELEEAQEQARKLLQDKILVGHALKNDLHALQIQHAWYATRDTGKYEPFQKQRFNDGILWPRKLKDLAKEKLGRDIQVMGQAHSPYEDAKTAMDLYKLVRNKWEKAMEYKYNKTLQIEQQLMELQQQESTKSIVTTTMPVEQLAQ